STLINAHTATITGQITDATAVSVTVGGVVAAVTGGGFTATDVPIAEGPNEVAVLATDAAGNVGKATLSLVGADLTSPPAPALFAIGSPTRLKHAVIS